MNEKVQIYSLFLNVNNRKRGRPTKVLLAPANSVKYTIIELCASQSPSKRDLALIMA